MKINTFKHFITFTFCCLILNSVAFNQMKSQNLSKTDNDILNAMRDEIKVNLNELKLESLKSPYYIEYELVISEPINIKYSSGKLVEKLENKSASVSVGLRVGDYKFDNTNFFDVGLSFFGSSDDEERFRRRSIPIEIDYNTLRKELWLATDAAYKQNSEIYSKKVSALKNRMKKDTIDDFITIKVNKNYNKKEFPKLDIDYYADALKSASDVFKNTKEIYTNAANLEFSRKTKYYVNSEGIEYITTESYTGIEIVAFTQATDGMPLSDFISFYAKDPKFLPNKDSIAKATKNMMNNLVNLSKSNVLEDAYSGPILFEDQAACEIFAQVFTPNFVAQRSLMTESGSQEVDRFSAFQNKIGARVLPEYLSIDDLPNQVNYGNTNLLGHYAFDEDGLEAQDLNLVQDGYLKNLISGRTPNKKIKVSNAHKRGGSPIFSNILVNYNPKSKNVLSKKDMKSKLIKLVKDRNLDYGIIIKKIHNLNIYSTTMYSASLGSIEFIRGEGNFPIVEAYKIYKDGKEELIRGLKGYNFSTQTFKDILNVSKDIYSYNYLAPAVVSNFVSGGEQYVTASISSPSLLFEDGELRVIESDFKKPPTLSRPISNK